MIYYWRYETPIGDLLAAEEDGAVIRLCMAREGGNFPEEQGEGAAQEKETRVLKQVYQELTEYFQGRRRDFHTPVQLLGSSFQMDVWEALQRIPYGETRSYGQLAASIGKPRACRAVGGANHKNPVMILVPCHRVIGADGSLTGFGGGLDVKQQLLELERRFKEQRL